MSFCDAKRTAFVEEPLSMKRITVRRCNNVIEADTLRIRLAAAGIDAVVQGGEGATTLSHIGGAAGYPQVDVSSEDYDRAVAMLQADESARLHTQPWICSRCEERNEATFDLCWSCQKPREASDRAVAAARSRPPSWQADDDADAPEERRELIPDSLYIAVEVLAIIVAALVAIAFFAMNQ